MATQRGPTAEYQRQRRLRLNPDVFSRVTVKVKKYLSRRQAEEIEVAIDKMIGIEPRIKRKESKDA